MVESKIIKKYKNPFLGREEISIEIKSDVSPGYSDVKKAIGKNEELIVVKKIHSNFGRKTFTAEAVLYDNEESKKKVETISKKARKKLAEEHKVKKEAERKVAAEAKKAKEVVKSTEGETTKE